MFTYDNDDTDLIVSCNFNDINISDLDPHEIFKEGSTWTDCRLLYKQLFFCPFSPLAPSCSGKIAGIFWSSSSLFDDIAINEFLILNGNKNFKILACPLPSYAISPRKFHPTWRSNHNPDLFAEGLQRLGRNLRLRTLTVPPLNRV